MAVVGGATTRDRRRDAVEWVHMIPRTVSATVFGSGKSHIGACTCEAPDRRRRTRLVQIAEYVHSNGAEDTCRGRSTNLSVMVVASASMHRRNGAWIPPCPLLFPRRGGKWLLLSAPGGPGFDIELDYRTRKEFLPPQRLPFLRIYILRKVNMLWASANRATAYEKE